MIIERKSFLTGIVRQLSIPVTEDELHKWQHEGVLIQIALPNLTPDQREFLMTGVVPEEWDEAFETESVTTGPTDLTNIV